MLGWNVLCMVWYRYFCVLCMVLGGFWLFVSSVVMVVLSVLVMFISWCGE